MNPVEDVEPVLDCWISVCARPRIPGSVFCAAHDAQVKAAETAREASRPA